MIHRIYAISQQDSIAYHYYLIYPEEYVTLEFVTSPPAPCSGSESGIQEQTRQDTKDDLCQVEICEFSGSALPTPSEGSRRTESTPNISDHYSLYSNICQTDDARNYDTQVTCGVMYGRFIFCGNFSSPFGTGLTLTNQCKRSAGDTNTLIIIITIQMNQELLADTDYIELYDENNGLRGYSSSPIRSGTYQFVRPISPEDVGKKFCINFSSKRTLTTDERRTVRKRMLRKPKVVHYAHTLRVQDVIDIEDQQCTICLEEVADRSESLIPVCGHVFHLECIWKYLERRQLLKPVHAQCATKSGCNTAKPQHFQCPNCRETVLTHFSN